MIFPLNFRTKKLFALSNTHTQRSYVFHFKYFVPYITENKVVVKNKLLEHDPEIVAAAARNTMEILNVCQRMYFYYCRQIILSTGVYKNKL